MGTARVIIVWLLATCCLTSLAMAQAPPLLNYQGRLTDTEGAPLDTVVDLTFDLFEDETGAVSLWTETHYGVPIGGGLFAVILGDNTPFPEGLFSGPVRFLGVTIGDGSVSDPLTPIVSVAYAMTAGGAEFSHMAGMAETVPESALGSFHILDGSLGLHDISVEGAAEGQVIKLVGDAWLPADDEIGGGSGAAWVDDGTTVRLSGANDSVGIGTSSPQHRLEVVGPILSGYGNTVVDTLSAIAGGNANYADSASFVGGGEANAANTRLGTVCGGWANAVHGLAGSIVGGQLNYIQTGAINGTVGGGVSNAVYGREGTIAGGGVNDVTGEAATVGGGYVDSASGDYSTISGGHENDAEGNRTAIGGGYANRASGGAASVGGGQYNLAMGFQSTVAGGESDTASGWRSSIGGGYANVASDTWARVGGGAFNVASDSGAVVAGGSHNESSHWYAVVGGGHWDTASGWSATVAGGEGNAASGSNSTIGGGFNNKVGEQMSTIGGGESNQITTMYSTISGGISNEVTGFNATIGGGRNNTASGGLATIGGGGGDAGDGNVVSAGGGTISGGSGNQVSGNCSVVAGGSWNWATGFYSTISGGYFNYNQSNYSSILGGESDTIAGVAEHSVVFGEGVYVGNAYRAVFFDGLAPGRLGVNRDDRDGGVNHPIHVGTNTANGNGAHLTAGGAWTNGSSRAFKERFETLNGRDVLASLAELPVTAWRYKDRDERHIGPIAEDFVAAFDVGTSGAEGERDNRYLSTVDVSGVALIGVQELNRLVQSQAEQIELLKADLKSLRAEMELSKSRPGSDNENVVF